MKLITPRRAAGLGAAALVVLSTALSAPAEAAITRPKPPTAVRASIVVPKTNTATVTFRKPLSNGGARILRYNVRCASPVGITKTATTTTTTAKVTGLTWAKPYVCFVSAVNRKGASKATASNPFQVPFKPVPPAPTGTIQIDCTSKQVTATLKNFPASESHSTFLIVENETDGDFSVGMKPFQGSWSGIHPFPETWSGHGSIKINTGISIDGPGHQIYAEDHDTCNL